MLISVERATTAQSPPLPWATRDRVTRPYASPGVTVDDRPHRRASYTAFAAPQKQWQLLQLSRCLTSGTAVDARGSTRNTKASGDFYVGASSRASLPISEKRYQRMRKGRDTWFLYFSLPLSSGPRPAFVPLPTWPRPGRKPEARNERKQGLAEGRRPRANTDRQRELFFVSLFPRLERSTRRVSCCGTCVLGWSGSGVQEGERGPCLCAERA